MATRESAENPFLQGNFGPWRLEGDAPALEVVGELPRDLNGTYYRNGPNPAYEPAGRYHWFDGDGMIHAITLERRARVVPQSLGAERRPDGGARAPARRSIPGLLDIAADRGAVLQEHRQHQHRLACGQAAGADGGRAADRSSRPDTLATVGEYDFEGRLAGPMTAHPKMDPETGEMLFFGYSPFPPYLQYHVADRARRAACAAR